MYHKIYDLVDLALANPKIGTVNHFMLYTLLHALIKRLGIGSTRVYVSEEQKEIILKKNSDLNYHSDGSIKSSQKGSSASSIEFQSLGSVIAIIPEQNKELSRTTSRPSTKDYVREHSNRNLKHRYDSLGHPFEALKPVTGSCSIPSVGIEIDSKDGIAKNGVPFLEYKMNEIVNKLRHLPSEEHVEIFFDIFSSVIPITTFENGQDKLLEEMSYFRKILHDNNIMEMKLIGIELKLEEAIRNIEILAATVKQMEILHTTKNQENSAAHLESSQIYVPNEPKVSDLTNDDVSLLQRKPENQSFPNHLIQLENDLTHIKSYLFNIKSNENSAAHLDSSQIYVPNEPKVSDLTNDDVSLLQRKPENQSLPNRLIQLENDLTQIKSYLFSIKSNVRTSSLHINAAIPPKFMTEEQSNDLGEHMENVNKQSSVSTNTYNQLQFLQENVNSMEDSSEFLDQNIKLIWREIKDIEGMLIEQSGAFKHLLATEKKNDTKFEILEENLHEMIYDNKTLKKAISCFEHEHFNRSQPALDFEQSHSEKFGTRDSLPETFVMAERERTPTPVVEMEKRIKEQKAHLYNQLQFINQLVTTKYDRIEMEKFKTSLLSSLNKFFKDENKDEEEVFTIVKSDPEKCLSCNKPVKLKSPSEISIDSPTRSPLYKTLDKSEIDTASASNLLSCHGRHATGGPYFRIRNIPDFTEKKAWLKGRDDKLYKRVVDDEYKKKKPLLDESILNDAVPTGLTDEEREILIKWNQLNAEERLLTSEFEQLNNENTNIKLRQPSELELLNLELDISSLSLRSESLDFPS